MPLLLEGSCHCRAIKYTVESNTPVPYQLCPCSICRKTGGYVGSVNIMGNTDTLKVVKGAAKMKEYYAPLAFDAHDEPTETSTGKRVFCAECSAMLWNYSPEWPHWIYPFASSIDTPLPAADPALAYTIQRASCPDYVPTPAGWTVYDAYGPGKGIEEWHKMNGQWVE